MPTTSTRAVRLALIDDIEYANAIEAMGEDGTNDAEHDALSSIIDAARTSLAVGGDETFTLDRSRFADYLLARDGQLATFDSGSDRWICEQLSVAVRDALCADAIVHPVGVTVQVYGLRDTVIVAVRESRTDGILQRQVSTWSIEQREIVPLHRQDFDSLCVAVEETLERATRLMPSLRALQAIESARDAA